MSTVKVFPIKREAESPSSSLPQLIQTPSGLALLELQGTINLPSGPAGGNDEALAVPEVEIGRIDFPDYHPETQLEGSTAWMKRVYLYVGQHQRLTGEVKKLPKAVAVIRKREGSESIGEEGTVEELEVLEIVKYKLVFSQRPEPVGTAPT